MTKNNKDSYCLNCGKIENPLFSPEAGLCYECYCEEVNKQAEESKNNILEEEEED
jgi:NMD protein affecting ribosome stability and mRNA decay